MFKIRKILHSIRWRLTLWFMLALALALIIFSVTIYFAMRQALNLQLETTLQDGTMALAENLKHEFEEGDPVREAAETVVRDSSFRQLQVEIYSPEAEMIAASGNLKEPDLGTKLNFSNIPVLGNGLATGFIKDSKIDPAGFKTAAVRVIHPVTGGLYTIVVGGKKSIVTNELATLRNIIFGLAPLLLLIAGVGGFYLSKRALKPVSDMTRQARKMNAARLSERLTVSDPEDELGLLAGTFNELFDRIEQSFGQMRQFIADASHELRTPVTVIRSETEVALTEPREEAEAFSSLEVIRDEATRMSRLVEDMFTLARADADDRDVLKIENVPLAELIDTCARSAEALGRSRQVGVIVENLLDPHIICRGDRIRLAQMLLNLLDNATKYTPKEGLVAIKAALDKTSPNLQAVISITDNGPGIPAEFREKVFTRFYRLDKARPREHGGSGLGLSIARRIAELHGGALTLADADGGGSVFKVFLPVNK